MGIFAFDIFIWTFFYCNLFTIFLTCSSFSFQSYSSWQLCRKLQKWKLQALHVQSGLDQELAACQDFAERRRPGIVGGARPRVGGCCAAQWDGGTARSVPELSSAVARAEAHSRLDNNVDSSAAALLWLRRVRDELSHLLFLSCVSQTWFLHSSASVWWDGKP